MTAENRQVSFYPAVLTTTRDPAVETYDAVELAAFVTLRAAQAVNAFGFARAELAEVLGRPGHHVLEELKRDAAQRFAWRWCEQQQWSDGVWCQCFGETIPPRVMSKNTLQEMSC